MQVWAHRGASGYAPENTLPSFEKAADLRADGVELDIQLTRDGRIVVFHDETVDRTTDGSGWVKDFSFAEVRKLDASYQNLMQAGRPVKRAKLFEDYRDVRIPTIEEVYELLRPTSLLINVELKTGVIFYPGIEEKILNITRDMGMEDRVVYSSFNHYSVRKLHALDPDARLGVLYMDGPVGIADYARSLGAWAIHPALYNLQVPGLVEECHEKGLLVNAWTADRPEYVDLCHRAGVDAVITGYPDTAAKRLGPQQ